MELLPLDRAVVALIPRIDVAKLVASRTSALDFEVLSFLNFNTHYAEILKVDCVEFSFALVLVRLSSGLEPLARFFLLDPELEFKRKLFVVVIFVPQKAIHLKWHFRSELQRI